MKLQMDKGSIINAVNVQILPLLDQNYPCWQEKVWVIGCIMSIFQVEPRNFQGCQEISNPRNHTLPTLPTTFH